MLSAICVLREGDGKGASLIQRARDRDVTPMGPGNGPGQAEPQTDTCLGPALIASIESFKNTGKIVRRNADSGIIDGDDNPLRHFRKQRRSPIPLTECT